MLVLGVNVGNTCGEHAWRTRVGNTRGEHAWRTRVANTRGVCTPRWICRPIRGFLVFALKNRECILSLNIDINTNL
jgi:hypothetical protein